LKPSLVKVFLYIILKDVIVGQMKSMNSMKSTQSIDTHRMEAFSKLLMVDYMSGVIAETAIFPFTVIVRKLQTYGNTTNFMDCVQNIWKTEGIKGFFNGFGYHFTYSLLIYFGTMAFFAFSRLFISQSKTIIDQMEQKDEDSEDEL